MEKRIKGNRSPNYVIRKSYINHQTTAIQKQNGIEERKQDKMKKVTEKFYEEPLSTKVAKLNRVEQQGRVLDVGS